MAKVVNTRTYILSETLDPRMKASDIIHVSATYRLPYYTHIPQTSVINYVIVILQTHLLQMCIYIDIETLTLFGEQFDWQGPVRAGASLGGR